MKSLRFGLLALTLFIGGCISTGVRIGPVFIPVETSAAKKKPESQEDPDEKLPPRSQNREKLEVSDSDPQKRHEQDIKDKEQDGPSVQANFDDCL